MRRGGLRPDPVELDPLLLEAAWTTQGTSGSFLMQESWGHARTLFHVQYDVARTVQGT